MTKPRRRLETNGTKDLYEIAPQFEITVTGHRRYPYRSVYQDNNNKIINTVGNVAKRAISGTVDTIGKAIETPFRGYIALQNSMYNSEDSYSNADRKFDYNGKDNVVNVSNGVKGQRDLLGMMGAVKGDDGIYRFKNENYQGPWQDKDGTLHGAVGGEEYLRWCAENANIINRYFRKPTVGNAWTRHGVYGDSAIVVSPDVKSDYHGPLKERKMANNQADYVKENINNADLHSGDIVDMYYNSSSFLDRAAAEGDPNRVNTHTGTVLRTGPNKEDTFVMHSMGNGIRVEPIGQFIGSRIGKPYITGIRRPGTKNHPYRSQKRDGGSIHIAPSKRGTFRAAASKHGMGVQEFASRVLANKDNYSSGMVKKANFARNTSKWH